jgi:riboflavin kinase, archaea type
LPKIVFEGTVFSGTGNGKEFVNLPWVKRQIEEKLVFIPYAGTLNIRLTEDSAQKRSRLEKVQGIKIEPQIGYCQGVLFRASFGALDCAVVIPKVPNYPSDELEVIAPVYLRGELKLVDGCLVTVTVNV